MRLTSFPRGHYSRLAAERRMTSLIEREFAAAGEDFVEIDCDWIRAVYDPHQAVTSDDGLRVAYRAISDQGELHWLVFTQGKKRPYHSESLCPFQAFDDARIAMARRRMVRANWADVQALMRDLRFGRARFRVIIGDAYASPLCVMGVRHFLRRVGLSRVQTMSGTILAWLALLDPQLGFVIAQAAQRTGLTVTEPETVLDTATG